MLRQYMKMSSKLHYGLTNVAARKLAYEYAKKLGLRYPNSWEKNKIAGREWLIGFMSRAKDLSLRTPEATSLSRGTSFNKTNVETFFAKLQAILERYKFPPENIYNADETAVTTVHKPPKVISIKGQKQVGQATSAERGQLVTMCNFVNAVGNTIPPVYIFPRVKFKTPMLNGAPPSSLGLSYQSGWMTSDNFLHAMQHFIKHSKASVDNPVLLILDNHESHLNINVIDEAKNNGVHMLTFPPHCSHRLQPLDVAVYGPFKAAYNVAMNNWMINNPAKTVSIYEVAEISGIAFNAMSRKNILSGFAKTGIQPFNPQIFTDDDFLMSAVTDRPCPSDNNESVEQNYSNICSDDNLTNEKVSNLTPITNFMDTAISLPRQSSCNLLPGPSSCGVSPAEPSSCGVSPAGPSSCGVLSTSKIRTLLKPEDVVPFPKAAPRVGNRKGKAKGKTLILTDTPEKLELQLLQASNRKRKVSITDVNRVKKKVKCNDSDTESEEEVNLKEITDDLSSDGLEDIYSDVEESFDTSPDNVNIGDYILARFLLSKSNLVYYIGQVVGSGETKDYLVNFYRRKRSTYHFVSPDVEDQYEVEKNEVLYKLPAPKINNGTARTARTLQFPINLNKFNSTLR